MPGVEELTAGTPSSWWSRTPGARRRPSVGATGLVIACDTDVVLDGEVLGKPADAAEARAISTG